MESFNLYFKYENLPLATIARLLKEMKNLHSSVQESIITTQYRDIPHRFFSNHTLLIDSVNTGDSIRFKFKEGWMPSARYTGDAESWYDVEIGIPKKLGTAAVIGYLLLEAASRAIAVRTDFLQMEIRGYEHALVEQEYMAIIQSFSAREKLDHAAKTDTLLLHLMDIPSLDDLKINDVTVYTSTDSN